MYPGVQEPVTLFAMKSTQITICGAGIAGIATAFYLAIKYHQKQIVLIDKNLPMSLTTSKSGENFREYWPQPCMTALTRHSIDLMKVLADDSDNTFNMQYSGYDFVSESVGRDIFPAKHLDETGSLSQITGGKSVREKHAYLGSFDSAIGTH